MFRFLIFLVTLSLLALSIIISMLNPLSIEIDLYFHKYSAPLPLFLFVSFLVGSFLALLFFLSAYISHKHEGMGLRKILKTKEDEIDSLRKNPLRDDHE
jgi:uncharacterized integral membrane protein